MVWFICWIESLLAAEKMMWSLAKVNAGIVGMIYFLMTFAYKFPRKNIKSHNERIWGKRIPLSETSSMTKPWGLTSIYIYLVGN